VTPADIEAQVGAAQGLWTHTPVDWAGNEPPPSAKPASWPANASQGFLGIGEGTRPGGAVTQSGPPGAPKILGLAPTNLTSSGFGVAVTFDAAVVSCAVNYGPTSALGSSSAGTTAAGQTISVTGLTTKTTYYFRVTATNATGTTTSTLYQVTTF
jgi:hypothetical protein